MRRREFIPLLCLAASSPLIAHAQQRAMLVIGFLAGTSPGPWASRLRAFHQGLSEAGYVEGQTIMVEYRWADGHNERLPQLAADLVIRQVSVIVAPGGNAPALAAKAATTTIPIVFVSGGDPVHAGLVASLNRPGGNVTGVSSILTELVPKRLELLREIVPKAAALAALVNPKYPDVTLQLRELQVLAKTTSQQIRIFKAGTESEIDAAFATFAQLRIDALIVANDPFFDTRRTQIIALAARHGLPAIYSGREYVMAGGLISYGPNLIDAFHQAGVYTSRILKGANPADLPVLQPTKFELLVNLKTAKALGITISETFLLRADEVIE